jgi:large subunit ribosomal protein L10
VDHVPASVGAGIFVEKEVIGLAISKQKKVELVEQYVEQLKKSQGLILVNYQGLNVNQITEVRAALRPIGGKFQVIKNRLLVRALEEAGVSLPEEWLSGPTVVSFCFDQVPPVAKALVDAAKELEALSIRGGLLGTVVLEPSDVQAIADLPSREVLLAQVLGTINAPASQMAGVIASGIRQVVNVLQAYVDKLQEASGGAALEQAAEPA